VCGLVQQRLAAQATGDAVGFLDGGRGDLGVAGVHEVLGVVEQVVREMIGGAQLEQAGDSGGEAEYGGPSPSREASRARTRPCSARSRGPGTRTGRSRAVRAAPGRRRCRPARPRSACCFQWRGWCVMPNSVCRVALTAAAGSPRRFASRAVAAQPPERVVAVGEGYPAYRWLLAAGRGRRRRCAGRR
jgi:hypothetical protein